MSAGAAGGSGSTGGSPPLRPVPLQELRLRADALLWPVDQKLADLDSLTPVRGQLWARHHGSVLEVEGEAETIVTLCCDRCLQHFNRPLRAAVHELLELAGGDELEGSDLTALAGSAAGTGATRARFRPTGSGRPPADGRDRGGRDAAAGSDRSHSRASGQGQAPGSVQAPSPGSQPRRGSRTKSNPEPLLIEVLDDRLDPRGDFDPERWLFEQLSLQLPVVNRCGADCPGPPRAPGAAAVAIPSLAAAGMPVVPLGQARKPDGELPAAAAGPGPRTSGDHGNGNPQASASTPAGCDLIGGAASSPGPVSGKAHAATIEPGPGPGPEPEPEPAIDPRWAALRQLLP